MSTTLLIGRWPEAIRRAFSHAGDGPIVTSSNSRAVKRGHRSGRLDLDVARPRRRRACRDRRATAAGSAARRWRRAPRARRRRSTGSPAGWSVIASSSTSVAIGSTSASGVPGVQLVVEDHDPVVVDADRDLVLGQDHARRTATPRSFARFRRVPSGITAPGQRDADGLAGGDVGRAADDLRDVALARWRRWQTRQAVGVRVLLALEHAADDEVVQRGDAVRVDARRPRCRSCPGARRAWPASSPGST